MCKETCSYIATHTITTDSFVIGIETSSCYVATLHEVKHVATVA